jgi:5-methylcytosine-specific restriction endonuclease McrA
VVASRRFKGPTTYRNLQTLCVRCNSIKGRYRVVDFRRDPMAQWFADPIVATRT